MDALWLSWLVLILVALFWIVADSVAGLRTLRMSHNQDAVRHYVEDFNILVPIYGHTRFLENVQYLTQYGDRVILCTTSGESAEFMRELSKIARDNGFTLFQSAYAANSSSQARRTGGTIRDRIVRDALNHAVTRPFTVCIDADTTTPESLAVLVGELAFRGDDLASIRLVPQSAGPLVVQLQRHEYRQAMKMRLLVPWLISGACHVGRTDALRHIMRCHSLFFQGNDVETGLLGTQLGYRISHIPFAVNTNVPATWKSWWRQRLAWSGGEFRLFVTNFRFIATHPFLWFYGAVISIGLVALRWLALGSPNLTLAVIAAVYCGLLWWMHWPERNRWLLLLPLYAIVNSLLITPVGIVWYFVMAIPERNFGVIRVRDRAAVVGPVELARAL